MISKMVLSKVMSHQTMKKWALQTKFGEKIIFSEFIKWDVKWKSSPSSVTFIKQHGVRNACKKSYGISNTSVRGPNDPQGSLWANATYRPLKNFPLFLISIDRAQNCAQNMWKLIPRKKDLWNDIRNQSKIA